MSRSATAPTTSSDAAPLPLGPIFHGNPDRLPWCVSIGDLREVMPGLSRAAQIIPCAPEFELNESAPLRGVHAFRQQTFFQSRQLVRYGLPRASKFSDPLFNECVALARIVIRLFHLVDQLSKLAAAHLLCHIASVSRSISRKAF